MFVSESSSLIFRSSGMSAGGTRPPPVAKKWGYIKTRLLVFNLRKRAVP